LVIIESQTISLLKISRRKFQIPPVTNKILKECGLLPKDGNPYSYTRFQMAILKKIIFTISFLY